MCSSPLLNVLLAFMTVLTFVWSLINAFVCSPTQPGTPSALSNFHLLEIRVGNQAVRMGYAAFCTPGTSATGERTQICVYNGPFSNPRDLSRLPGLDPRLLNLARVLQASAFPNLPIATFVLMFLMSLLLIVHYAIRNKKNYRSTQVIMLIIFALLGGALLLSLSAAMFVTLTTAALANLTDLTNAGIIITRGQLGFVFHWVNFATILFVSLLSFVLLPDAGRASSRGGSDYTYKSDW